MWVCMDIEECLMYGYTWCEFQCVGIHGVSVWCVGIRGGSVRCVGIRGVSVHAEF